MKLILAMTLALITFSGLAQNNPVIVELFTSQGCSSCPSADKNLTELLKQYNQQGKPVYGLSFHVDYWNYLGWKDPYSSKEFTQRQRQYAQQLNLNSIYTPQMIVNGTTEFVGSSKADATRAIEAKLNANSNYKIVINDLKLNGNSVGFEYTLDNVPANCQLRVAIVDKSVENEVPAGENSGRRLHHDNVVCAFQTVTPKLSGAVNLAVAKPNFSNSLLIIYLQDDQLQVLAAASKAIQ